nr:MAG TPA: hypothetical protein [Caudoviricetes sp.]
MNHHHSRYVLSVAHAGGVVGRRRAGVKGCCVFYCKNKCI